MKNNIVIFGFFTCLYFSAFAQNVYKCGNFYSDSKCASDANIVIKGDAERRKEEGDKLIRKLEAERRANTAADEQRSKKIEAETKASIAVLERRRGSLPKRAWGVESMNRIQESCKLKILAILKDPNSANFSSFTILEKASSYYSDGYVFSSADFGDRALFAAEVMLYVNAKNSYGGYTGDKKWRCLLDWETGTKVISVDSMEPK